VGGDEIRKVILRGNVLREFEDELFECFSCGVTSRQKREDARGLREGIEKRWRTRGFEGAVKEVVVASLDPRVQPRVVLNALSDLGSLRFESGHSAGDLVGARLQIFKRTDKVISNVFEEGFLTGCEFVELECESVDKEDVHQRILQKEEKVCA
jgi:hypothetical protein